GSGGSADPAISNYDRVRRGIDPGAVSVGDAETGDVCDAGDPRRSPTGRGARAAFRIGPRSEGSGEGPGSGAGAGLRFGEGVGRGHRGTLDWIRCVSAVSRDGSAGG